MNKSIVMAAAALSLLAIMASSADAHLFKHRSAYYTYCNSYWPLYSCGGCGYGYGCGAGYGCGYGGYGYGGACGGDCGYGGSCGYTACYARPRCHLFGWLHRCCLKHRNRGCYTAYGCDGDLCATGGCTSGACGSTSGETVAPGETLPQSGEVPVPVADPQTSNSVHSKFRLTSSVRHDGAPAFQRGLTAFRAKNMNGAAAEFNAAAELEPDNALYHYYLAMSTFETAGADAANEARQKAIELELREPIKDWGRRMERIQGRSRVWIEQARRDAGLVR